MMGVFTQMHKIATLLIILVLSISLMGCQKDNQDTSQDETSLNQSNLSDTTGEEDLASEENLTSDEEENLQEEVIEETVKVDDHQGQAKSPLTGLYIDEEVADRRPVGIMINNYKAAIPQSGISQAEVIYETLVEGGITRLFAVFQDFDAEKIGLIRSARHYYLDFALDHDAIYTHSGQSPQAKAAFSKLDVDRFDGGYYMGDMFTYRSDDRVAPHNLYTTAEMLFYTWDEVGYRKELDPNDDNKLHFIQSPAKYENQEDVTNIILDYSYYIKPQLVYNEETMTYDRFEFDAPHIDAENDEQLSFKNIIIQFTSIWAIPGDDKDRMDMTLVGEGEGMYISNGKMIPITWKKESHYDPTQYYDESGRLLLMNPGKTFISVFPSNRMNKIIME